MINLAGNPLEDRGTYYHRCQRCRTLASCFTGLGSSTNFRLVTWSPCHTKSRPHKPGGLSTLALTHTLRVSLACTWNAPHSTRVLPTPTRNSPHTQVESRPCSSWVLLINGQQQSNFPWDCRAQGPCALAQSQWRPLRDLIGCLCLPSHREVCGVRDQLEPASGAFASFTYLSDRVTHSIKAFWGLYYFFETRLLLCSVV